VGGHYRSTAPVRFTAYYRNESGGWVWWSQSGLLAESTAYTLGHWSTPPLPSGASISVGLSIYEAGTLDMDAFSLADAGAAVLEPGPDAPAPLGPTGPVVVSCDGESCAGRWYHRPVAVTLDAGGDRASEIEAIHYTLDGSDPELPGAPAYAAPFPVSRTTTVRYSALASSGATLARGSQLVQIDRAAPTGVAVAAPAAGAFVSGVTPIVANAGDDVAIHRVRFYLDGLQLGTRTTQPFHWNWDTSAIAEGPHTLAVQAEDPAGNATRSAEVSVTIR
jgi:hypothetical protein